MKGSALGTPLPEKEWNSAAVFSSLLIKKNVIPRAQMEGLVELFGIRDMSPELRERIAADIIAVSRDPTVISTLNATGQTPNPGGPKEFAESMAHQRERIAIIAKEIDIIPQQ